MVNSEGNMVAMATPAQIKWCEDMIDEGAPHELNMLCDLTMEDADAFIRKNKHYTLRKATLTAMSNRSRMDEWGGIPNC